MDKNQYIEKTLLTYSDGISRNFQLFGREIFPELSRDDLQEILGIMIQEELLQCEEMRPGAYKLGVVGDLVLREGGWYNYLKMRKEITKNAWLKIQTIFK
jgi:hypothetical protein